MNNRKLFRDETDTFSAASAEEATQMRDKLCGFTPGEKWYPDEPFEPMDDGETLKVRLQDGWEGDGKYPSWVDGEPEAHVTWDESTTPHIATVIAPARIWAKHETGMVCSTEY